MLSNPAIPLIRAALIASCITVATTLFSQNMDNQHLLLILHEEADSIAGPPGGWTFQYEGMMMFLLTDESFNRMRIIAPIDLVDQLEEGELRKAMEANFHSALDVRYAISDGIMWSAFIHPLKELSDEQFRDALSQVYQAADTFGTSYSSTDLVFPGPKGEGEEGPPVKNKKM